jgi:hypothetical protein
MDDKAWITATRVSTVVLLLGAFGLLMADDPLVRGWCWVLLLLAALVCWWAIQRLRNRRKGDDGDIYDGRDVREPSDRHDHDGADDGD